MLQQVLKMIEESKAERLLVTIDGPCASGKTTFARGLSEAISAPVIHTDDFVVPHAKKTAERLALPGGNCDAERLVQEVLAPFQRGEPVRFHRYDCREDCLLPEEELPKGVRLLILEGSYCNLPVLRAYANLRLFMDTPEKIRMERLRKRETPESLRRFREMWIPLENAYFQAYHLPDGGCVIVSGGANG